MKISEVKNSAYRGHEIKLDLSKANGEELTIKEYNAKFGTPSCIYCDTLMPLDANRPCKKCDAVIPKGEPDACIGCIKDVTGACCGHGSEFGFKRYVNLPNVDDNGSGGLHLREENYDLFMESKDYSTFRAEYLKRNPEYTDLTHLTFDAKIKEMIAAGYTRHTI